LSNISRNYARNFFGLNFIFNKLILKKRIEILEIIKNNPKVKISDTILDVGTTSLPHDHENLIIKYFYKKKKITCLSNLDLNEFKKKFPLINNKKGDGRNMEFKDNEFDVVISNATIEHVGSFNNQIKFIKECTRVSKKLTVITTPDRLYPIDFHTRLPLLHLLPKPIHRKILNMIGEKFLSLEENLNLLSKRDLTVACKILGINKFEIKSIKLFGFQSNLILFIYN
jgi:hypothetical protein